MEEEADPSVEVLCLGLLWIPVPFPHWSEEVAEELEELPRFRIAMLWWYLIVAVFCFLNSLGFSVSKSTKNRI